MWYIIIAVVATIVQAEQKLSFEGAVTAGEGAVNAGGQGEIVVPTLTTSVTTRRIVTIDEILHGETTARPPSHIGTSSWGTNTKPPANSCTSSSGTPPPLKSGTNDRGTKVHPSVRPGTSSWGTFPKVTATAPAFSDHQAETKAVGSISWTLPGSRSLAPKASIFTASGSLFTTGSASQRIEVSSSIWEMPHGPLTIAPKVASTSTPQMDPVASADPGGASDIKSSYGASSATSLTVSGYAPSASAPHAPNMLPFTGSAGRVQPRLLLAIFGVFHH